MNAAAGAPPQIGEQQRLTATLVLSLLVHGIAILGLGFVLDDEAPLVPTLDVIFSHTRTPLTPEQADFLAQANNRGGGEHEVAQRPRDTQAGTIPLAEPGLAPLPEQRRAAVESPPPQARIVASRRGEDVVPTTQAEPEPAPVSPVRAARDAEMARLAAEVYLRSELYAKRPTRKFVSASTREYAYANYLRAWVDRAERVGNLNYPDEIRRRRLGGQVVISVGVRRDGTVESTRILRSSGTPMLDAAAERIVLLAEPFPPLPDGGDRVDILHVTRTWVFVPGGQLRTE
ncbi:energy transducer TonB [Pseudoxanthomonas broegbernensis]|uniref:Energy transducer TonB n=1 Tax=Pseudoxanthomonas broegbernensis TaxID=83619 RepID=A0A7V8GMN3_9GAMM|nr:energy transducer TonB [Pseudoxanthomonas broegbernensis]KAF1686508.1 energy transducer TonB [Pseudoxanthomonas broegbernensis]MBB6064233.1 protein TonB [Pseudoxanthomonas broegbernensis]